MAQTLAVISSAGEEGWIPLTGLHWRTFSQLQSSRAGSPGQEEAQMSSPARPAGGLGSAAAGGEPRGPRSRSQSCPFQPHELSSKFLSSSCPRKRGISLISTAEIGSIANN